MRPIIKNVHRITSYSIGFIVYFNDGSIARVNRNLTQKNKIKGIGIEKAGIISSSKDGSLVILGKNFKKEKSSEALIKIIDLNNSKIILNKKFGSFLRFATFAFSDDIILYGLFNGVWSWNKPWKDDASELTQNSVPIAKVFHDILVTVEQAVIVRKDTFIIALPIPDTFVFEGQISFHREWNRIFMNIAGKNVIKTWNINELHLKGSLYASILQWACFGENGTELIGLANVNDEFLWNINNGRVIEFNQSKKPISAVEWSPNMKFGAICHAYLLEIINEKNESLKKIEITLPHSVSWDKESKFLIYLGEFERAIHLRSMKDLNKDLEIYECEDQFHPTSLSISPNGNFLAYGRSPFGLDRLRIPGMGSMKTDYGYAIQIVKFKFGLGIIDRRTKKKRIILEEHKFPFYRVFFLSNSVLSAMDSQLNVVFVDINSGKPITKWWAMSPILRMTNHQNDVLVVDSGENSSLEPIVYKLTLHNILKKNNFEAR